MDAQILSARQVQKGVEALLQVIKKKKALLEEHEAVNLVFSVKKVPKGRSVTIKLNLPHWLNNQNREVCLFVKDLDRRDREYEKTVQHFKDFLTSRNIKVSQVIPLKALKLEYKAFEAKRNLANMFDVFLADARIIRLLPSYLGKAFYGRKRLPVQIRMDAKDLKAEFDAAVNNSRCIFGHGSSGMATVANTGMSADDITQNILASAEQLSVGLPGGAANVRSMHIKTPKSLSVPIYLSLDSPNDLELPVPKVHKEPVEAEEVTTVEGALVRVFPHGAVQVVDETTNKPLHLTKRIAQARKIKKRNVKTKQEFRKKGRKINKKENKGYKMKREKVNLQGNQKRKRTMNTVGKKAKKQKT